MEKIRRGWSGERGRRLATVASSAGLVVGRGVALVEAGRGRREDGVKAGRGVVVTGLGRKGRWYWYRAGVRVGAGRPEPSARAWAGLRAWVD
jgi:hypothetical protein